MTAGEPLGLPTTKEAHGAMSAQQPKPSKGAGRVPVPKAEPAADWVAPFVLKLFDRVVALEEIVGQLLKSAQSGGPLKPAPKPKKKAGGKAN